ncbi:MAG TPA: YggT family protein [Burkholderiales bacterium]|nr:YggT family protein [Burkholderiales bacterium]
MLGQIAVFLVDTLFTFFVFLLLARFHFQWLRVPFHNPAGEFVLAATSWLVMPVRRVVPGLRGYDIPTLLLAWILQALSLVAQIAIMGGEPRAVPVIAVAFVDLVRYSIYLLVFAVIVQAILSWVRTYSPFSPVLEAMTRPFLRPFRRFVPPLGGFDLSPLALLIVLQVVLIVLGHAKPVAATLG